jgi:hypothetical protein
MQMANLKDSYNNGSLDCYRRSKKLRMRQANYKQQMNNKEVKLKC